MTRIDISHDYCLTKQFRFLGIAVGLFSVFFLTQHPTLSGAIISLVSSIAGLLMLTARYGLALDVEQHRYQEYVRLLFYKNGPWLSYTGIEKIFVNKLKVSQTMVTRTGARFDTQSQDYQAYLKFDNGTKVELDGDSNKEKLFLRLRKYNEMLQAVIQDNAV